MYLSVCHLCLFICVSGSGWDGMGGGEALMCCGAGGDGERYAAKGVKGHDRKRECLMARR